MRFGPIGLAGMLVLGLCGCAVVPPSSPSVFVIPGQGKSYEQFQTDDSACRGTAAEASNVPAGTNPVLVSPGGLQRQYDITYLQCMAAKGHQVPQTVQVPVYVRPYPEFGPRFYVGPRFYGPYHRYPYYP